jgi:hypothetical protein
LNESGRFSPDAIERALAHTDADDVRAAYHRGAHWQERVEMAQWWSDYLDHLRAGVDILSPKQLAKQHRETVRAIASKTGYSSNVTMRIQFPGQSYG